MCTQLCMCTGVCPSAWVDRVESARYVRTHVRACVWMYVCQRVYVPGVKARPEQIFLEEWGEVDIEGMKRFVGARMPVCVFVLLFC